MKVIAVLPLAIVAAAFVIPDGEVMSQIALESHRNSAGLWDRLPSKEQISNAIEEGIDSIKQAFGGNALDEAFESSWLTETDSTSFDGEAFDAAGWLSSETMADDDEEDHEHPPHGKHPHHGHHGHHGRRGRHHGHKSNLTVYQLIAESKYTTKLAKLINKFPDLVEVLNGTASNFTIFAPTDRAFAKLPDHAKDVPDELIKKVLGYHVSDEFYPAGKVLAANTIPTLLVTEYLPGPQRLSINLNLRGLTVNFRTRVIAVNIFGSNGVIHGVDSVIIPPPKGTRILSLLPGEFSTLELALYKTGLFEALNDTSNHVGGTLFAPSNFAFQRLGPKINAFLFSSYGEKYLSALLKYHVVPNQTLYSDAFYPSKSDAAGVEGHIPKGLFHIELATLLKNRSLSVDVARWARFINIRINGYTDVTIQNGVAKDGVIQVLSNVLLPPKLLDGEQVQYDGGELEVEDLMARLDPLIQEDVATEL